jgi:carbon-monoxide dehydrogenase medium subunit
VKLPAFDYACPSSIEEAIALLAGAGGTAKLIAGGQSLIPVLAFRLAAPSLLVDLRAVPGLERINIAADGVRLGAKVRWRDIEGDTRLRSAHPLLVAAVAHVAHYQIRNRGTVGGSLAHADPAAEMPGIAVACDAELTLAGPRGSRVVPAREFFRGALSTALGHDELIVEVRLPPWPSGRRWGFEEFARRRGDFALAGVAAFYDVDESGKAANTHVAAIGAGDRPRRLTQAEVALDGTPVDAAAIKRAAGVARLEVQPSDDLHATAAYRRSLVETLVERALHRAAAREG